MDADGSHAPEDLPALLDAVDGRRAIWCIGSRYVPGGQVRNWPRRPRLDLPRPPTSTRGSRSA